MNQIRFLDMVVLSVVESLRVGFEPLGNLLQWIYIKFRTYVYLKVRMFFIAPRLYREKIMDEVQDRKTLRSTIAFLAWRARSGDTIDLYTFQGSGWVIPLQDQYTSDQHECIGSYLMNKIESKIKQRENEFDINMQSQAKINAMLDTLFMAYVETEEDNAIQDQKQMKYYDMEYCGDGCAGH